MGGRILLKGPFAPPNSLLYPSGRKTAHHLYRIWDEAGRTLMSGTCDADQAAALERVKRFAAEKGLDSPAVEIVAP